MAATLSEPRRAPRPLGVRDPPITPLGAPVTRTAVRRRHERRVLRPRHLEPPQRERPHRDPMLRTLALVVAALRRRRTHHERPGRDHHHLRARRAVAKHFAGPPPARRGVRRDHSPADCVSQVMLAQQRRILVRTLALVRRRQHPQPHPAEHDSDVHRILQVRQQRRGVRAVPPLPVVRRRARRRRVRHQGLVPQQVFVQVPEAAVAHAPRPRRPPHRPRQRVVPARVQDHQAQTRPRRRRQHVVQRHRLEPHVGVPLQSRVHRKQVVDAVHLHPVARVEHQGHVRALAVSRERPQRAGQRRQARVLRYRYLEP